MLEQHLSVLEGNLGDVWGPDYQFLDLLVSSAEGTEPCIDATPFGLDPNRQESDAIDCTSARLPGPSPAPFSVLLAGKDESEAARGAPRAVTPTASEEAAGTRAHGQGWQSPLHMAVQRGNDKIVTLLLKHCSDCNEPDGDGMTPLMYAVQGGHEDVVRTLLGNAARVPVQDGRGRSSIHWAVAQQHGAILRLLLENCHGLAAAVNAYDGRGQAPLHMAIDLGFEEGVKTLLQYGANLGLKARRL